MAMQFHTRLSHAFILVALGLGLIVGIHIFWVASRADTLAGNRQAALVRRALDEIGKSIERQQRSVTVWDDAVLGARTLNQQWLAENVGEWMYQFYGHDEVFILNAKDQPIYAMQGGKTVDPTTYSAASLTLDPLVARLRQKLSLARDKGAASVQDVRLEDGVPVLVSLTAIVPSTGRLTVPSGEEPIYISVVKLTDTFLRDMGDRYLISDVRFSPTPPSSSAEASIPLSIAGDRVGFVVWHPTRPGLAIVRQAAPVLLFAGICFIAFIYWLSRRLARTATELRASEQRAVFIAAHDSLTGLPNRAHLIESITERLRDLPSPERLVLFLLELDRFKTLNDTLGHGIGDELLLRVSSRLESLAGRVEIARVGSDEFAILWRAGPSDPTAEIMAERILAEIRLPFDLSGSRAFLDASIGIASAPLDAGDAPELVRKAGVALVEAERVGRGGVSRFSEGIDLQARQKQQIEHDLREALASDGQLHLKFQPIFSNDGHSVVGAEALLRWNHPTRGALSPSTFIPLAEECGLIGQVGQWALERAATLLKGLDLPWLAINASSIEVKDPNYSGQVLEILHRHGVAPSRIQIEVTETGVLEGDAATVETLQRLRSAGVRIALDDFGTGYSSLSHLNRYPVDKIKIDRSFVKPLGSEHGADAIVRAMLDLGRAFHISVTAEGVETQDQLDRLVGMGCGELQGFLLSRPINCDSLKQILAAKAA